MFHLETNGGDVRVIAPPAHPIDQGACCPDEPCVECAAAYAADDDARAAKEDSDGR